MKLNWNFPCGWCGIFLELRISKDQQHQFLCMIEVQDVFQTCMCYELILYIYFFIC